MKEGIWCVPGGDSDAESKSNYYKLNEVKVWELGDNWRLEYKPDPNLAVAPKTPPAAPPVAKTPVVLAPPAGTEPPGPPVAKAPVVDLASKAPPAAHPPGANSG